MKFAKIAGHDISGIFNNRFIRVSVIAILIVPMLYSLCYLAAFWNPYGRLDQLPVAVLNLDKGATLDGKEVNYGGNVVDDLKKNNEVKWSFITQEELAGGLQDTPYYSMFTIPEDFSQKIVTAKTASPAVAKIVYTSNQAKNFLASQISGNVETRLKDQVSASITREYTLAAFDGLYDAKDGLTEAQDGAGQLHDGLMTIQEKMPDLTNGAGQLANGASTLNSGLSTLNANTPALRNAGTQLKDGLNALNNQIPSLTDGANKLSEGTGALKSGINTLGSNSEMLADGINQSYAGADALNSGLNELSGSLPALKDGAAAVKDGTAALKTSAGGLRQGADQISGGLDTLIDSTSSTTEFDDAIAQITALIDSDPATAKAALGALESTYHNDLGALNGGLNQAKDGLSSLEDGLTQLQETLDPTDASGFAAGVDRLYSGIDSVSGAVSGLNDGSARLASGLAEIDQKLPTLTDGISQLSQGANRLDAGANALSAQTPALATGVSQLAKGGNALNGGIDQATEGISRLAQGSGELSSGFTALNGQLPALTDGVSKLNDGSAELASKLADGVQYVDGNLVNSSQAMADYISDPVTVLDEPINPVPDYGTGFTPYFVPLSLWVGAILMFFIISPKADPRFAAGSIQSVIGKYLSYAFIGFLQAVMVGAVVFALGLKVNHIGLYFFTIIVMSFTAIAIVQALISLLGDPGRLIAIVLLILQLTADAGTFPLELVPNFFRVINPFMPFTYCVSALREAISGSNVMLIWQCIGILAIFLGAFLLLSILFKKRGEKFQDKMEQMRLA